MPRTIDPMLTMALERANPNVCHFVEVNAPDVARVLRRGADQFLLPVSQSPANSIAADTAGALTIKSAEATLASFTVADDTPFLATQNLSIRLRGLAWQPAPAFARAVLSSFSARVTRQSTAVKNDLALQIYRMEGHSAPGGGIVLTPTPLLSQPVLWTNEDSKWTITATDTIAQFDLRPLHFEVGNLNRAAASFELRGEESWYYFVLEPQKANADDLFGWWRDRHTSGVVAGVGIFTDRLWYRLDPGNPVGWTLDGSLAAGVPYATIAIEDYLANAQAVYALNLTKTPAAASVGRVVFERGVPVGTAATLELSTAGTGGPWTTVKHGDTIGTKQQSYHARVTLASDSAHRVAPRVAALGVEFVIPYDTTAEAIVSPVNHEVEVPFLRPSIGEGNVTLVRTGRRDYRDIASDLASQYPTSKLEVDVFLGSRHPLVARDKWLLIDRALVNNRDPAATSERFGLLSYLKALKVKVPSIAESINVLMTVASATPTAVHLSGTLPDIDAGNYAGRRFYMRVRESSQANVSSGFIADIDGSSGTNVITFTAPGLPGTLIAGDLIEIHSASFLQQGITWVDEDPADVWFEILTVHLLIPAERLGRGDLGRVGLSGLPPTVADRAPGDLDTQAKLKVTLSTKGAESADELIAQLSFIMGGVTVDIGGQIVFRQVYPIRDASGQIVVHPEPAAATFDVRNTADLSTPTGLERRIAQMACDWGINTVASKDDAAAKTTMYVDVDAIAWSDFQPFDELAPAKIPDEISRWCYNSADGGSYLASLLAQQVVRAGSTGLRVWSWTATERHPQIVIGDRVVVITDAYTDYDPSRRVAIRGWWAFPLCVVAVQGGGTRFRGFMLGLTDAVQIKGGEGDLAVDEGTEAGEILEVTFKDFEDGTERTYDVVAGSAVETIHVHHRLWPVGTQGDPYDFDSDQDVHDSRELMIVHPDPADGHFRFTFRHPSRAFQRAIVLIPRQGSPSFAAGRETWKMMLDPAPPAMSAKIQALVTDATADVSVSVTAGVSDWPVRVDVFEGAPDSIPLLTVSLTGPATLDKNSHGVLGARPLPLNELETWYVRLTNVAKEELWFGPETADRDPLANGTVTIDDYRGDPLVRMVFDTNTDTIRITVPDGRTKTFTREQLDAAGSPVLYDVGDDLLDDLSTETDLGVDETREPYKVEYLGGGEWTTLFEGPLHGKPSTPPTAKIRVIKNTDGSAVDVYVIPDSPTNEKIRVFYRDGDSDLAPTYGLVVSAGDDTPLYVTRGTEVGPSNFFDAAPGGSSPSAKLGAIALSQDQIKPVLIGLKGEQSGVENWLPVTLSLLDKPYLESLAVDWDDAAGELVVTIVAGAKTKSATVQVADNEAFTSPSTTVVDLDTGDTEIVTFSRSAAQRGKTWYGRAKPWNKVSATGLDGDYQKDSVFVPALFTWDPHTSETAGQATVDILIDDPGGVLNASAVNHSVTGAIHWELLKRGVKSYLASSTVPGSGTSGHYTLTTDLDDKPHTIEVSAYAHLVDGSSEFLGSWTFDPDKLSNVKATVSYAGATAKITAKFDSDTATGAAGAHYRVDGGAWVDFTVNASTLIGEFSITALSSAKQVVDVEGKNVIDGLYGERVTVEVDRYGVGPSISAEYQRLTSSTGQIVWSGVGTITVSIDGGSFATPAASPIAITLDANTHSYRFKTTDFTGQDVYATVFVPALPSGGTVAFTSFGGVPNGGPDTITVSWTTAGSIAVDHYTLKWHYNGTDYDDPSTATDMGTVTSPFTHVKATGSGGHGYAIAATPLPPDGHQVDYFVTAYNAAGTVLASTGWFGVPLKVGP